MLSTLLPAIAAALLSFSPALPQTHSFSALPPICSLVRQAQTFQPQITMQTEYTYTGSPITPKYTLTDGENTLTEGVDFLVQSDREIIDAGEYTLTFTFIGDSSGTLTRTLTVLPADISKAGYHIEINDPLHIYYDNSPVSPQISVKAIDGSELDKQNYTVSCSNNNAPGRASVTVTAAGNYTGSLSYDFFIRPAAAKDIKIEKTGSDYITLGWSASPGADGYEIYKNYGGKWNKTAEADAYTLSKKLTKRKANTEYGFYVLAYKEIDGRRYYSPSSETVYAYTNAAKPAKVTLKSSDAEAEKITVKWKTVKNAAGYRVYRKSGSAWVKAGTAVGSSKSSYTVKGLDSETSYTFKVRAYSKGENGVTVWGSYSDTVSVTTNSADKLYYFNKTTDAFDSSFKKRAAIYSGSYYSGYFDGDHPDYVVINYMNSNYYVKKSAVSERKNAKILQTGTVGQMGGKIWGQAACGPTAAAILCNWQKNAGWNKDDLILYSEKHRLNDQGSLRGGGGMTAPKMIQLINGYSNGKFKAKNIYGSGSVSSVLKKQIDSGKRAIVVVQYTSYPVTHYASGTHFLVICGYEYINGSLYFYYADPYYGGGGRSLLRISSGTLAASMNMVAIEPRCIIVV